jgi:hypothetical protein
VEQHVEPLHVDDGTVRRRPPVTADGTREDGGPHLVEWEGLRALAVVDGPGVEDLGDLVVGETEGVAVALDPLDRGR